MKWDEGHVSENVEDKRGSTGRRGVAIGGGVGIVGVIIVLVSQALGYDVSGLFGSGDDTTTSSSTSSGTVDNSPETQKMIHFVSFVVDDVQDTFAKLFQAAGKTYRPAKFDLFSDEIDTGCGRSSAAVGPFYCPPDEKAYIDLSFYQLLRDRLGADGDFAQAYVLAHELGHHVQHLMGTDQQHDTRNNQESVMFELQADCYAGVWAHSANQRKLLEMGDFEEATNAAAQIGDDRLEKMAHQQVNPETFTHGTSKQRVYWFTQGFQKGTFDACDTFSGGGP